MRHGYGGGLFIGLLMLVLFLVVVGVLVWLAIRLFSSSGGGAAPRPTTGPPDALAILEDRLARGDLDVEDYRARRAALLEAYAAAAAPPVASPQPGAGPDSSTSS